MKKFLLITAIFVFIALVFMSLKVFDNESKTKDVARIYLERKGYRIVSYNGNVEKYQLTKGKLLQMPYSQYWQMQDVDPSELLGKTVVVEKFIVNNHPLDSWQSVSIRPEEVVKSKGKTDVWVYVVENQVVCGISYPVLNEFMAGGVWALDGRTWEQVHPNTNYVDWSKAWLERFQPSPAGVGQQIESKGNTVNNQNSVGDIVESYYKKHEPSNKGKTQIIAQKHYKDVTLVLTEKYTGDGHHITNLFLLDDNKRIIKKAQGATPISMCFTVNVIEYDGSKILFGTFNDSTWLIEPDKKKPVNIQNIMVRFKNSEVYTDKAEKGYIIYSKSLSDVEVVELYDDNGILQSDLNDLLRYGSVFNEASFVDIVQ